MIENYFLDYNVRSGFRKEFISLWSGWLGKENYHKLDEVTEADWSRFNELILAISEKFRIGVVDLASQTVSCPSDIRLNLSSYSESLDLTADKFGRFVLPDLDCILTEEWEYTYILWHKDNGALEKIKPLIERCGLKHFSE